MTKKEEEPTKEDKIEKPKKEKTIDKAKIIENVKG